MVECYLYKIQHKYLPIIYIGITNNPVVRFREHKNNSSNKLLKSYLSELGTDTFEFSIILKDTRASMEELEALVITEAKSLPRLIVCNVLDGSVFTGESSQIGEDHWNAKFSEKQIEEIRSVYSAGGITQKELGTIYGVSNKVVSKITSGTRWVKAPGTISINKVFNKVANRRKLTNEQVIMVRHEALEEFNTTGSVDIPEIASIYGVSRGSMRFILKGISYQELPGPILKKDYYKDFGHGS